MMHKNINIDSLSFEINTVKELLSSAQKYNDVVGKMQLEHRLSELSQKKQVILKEYLIVS